MGVICVTIFCKHQHGRDGNHAPHLVNRKYIQRLHSGSSFSIAMLDFDGYLWVLYWVVPLPSRVANEGLWESLGHPDLSQRNKASQIVLANMPSFL